MSNPFENPAPTGVPQAQPEAQQPYTAPQPGAYGAPAQGMPYQPQYGISQDALIADLKSKGTLSLVLSIVGIVFIGLFGTIPGWIIGSKAVNRAREAGIPEDFASTAKVGKIIGIVGTVMHVIFLIIGVLFFGTIVAIIMNDPQLLNEIANS